MPKHNLTATLRALAEAGIDFIVVGGVAAVLNGAPVDTFDVDVVHARDAPNVARLLPLLDSLDAASGWTISDLCNTDSHRIMLG